MKKTRHHQTNYCLAIGGRTGGWTNTLESWLNGNKISFLALLLLYFRYFVLIPTYMNPNNEFNPYSE